MFHEVAPGEDSDAVHDARTGLEADDGKPLERALFPQFPQSAQIVLADGAPCLRLNGAYWSEPVWYQLGWPSWTQCPSRGYCSSVPAGSSDNLSTHVLAFGRQAVLLRGRARRIGLRHFDKAEF